MFFPAKLLLIHLLCHLLPEEINKVVVSYKQLEAIILEKTITSKSEFIYVEGAVTKLEITLSQLDSLLFADNASFTIQLNVYLEGGTRHTSYEMKSDSGIQYLREPMEKEGGN